MCAVCVLMGWDRPPPPVQLEFCIEDEHGNPLECVQCGGPAEPRWGSGPYRWCPRCRMAITAA